MKIQKIDLSQERKILINCIVSDKFLTEISNIIQPELLESTYSRHVLNWILEYWGLYRQSPGKNIQDIYQQKIENIQNTEDINLIKEFISSLNDEYLKTPKNTEYTINKAVKYLKLRSLENLRDQIDDAIATTNVIGGEQVVANYKRVERNFGDSISILNAANRIRVAFTEQEEKLFRFQGDLGKATGFFVREDLVSFMGASGRGKSWWLMHLAQIAMMNGLRVVYFNFEMAENQLIRRMWQNNTAKPKEDKEIMIPYFEEDENDMFLVESRNEYRKGVDVSQIELKQKKYRGLYKGGDIRLISAPSHTTKASDIRGVLDNLIHYDNYIPDIVIVDYADLMIPERQYGEYRHQLNDIWLGLRRIAQQYKILVATATQSDRASFSRDGKEENISEDIRKYQHVSKFLVINSSKKEREMGVCRIEQLKERDGAVMNSQVVVLQCLDIGRPYLDSKFKKYVLMEE